MRKQVLLISGDFSLCKRFQEAMQDDSVEVQYFPTVADALDGYIRHHYCLIIMAVSYTHLTLPTTSRV